MSDDNQFQDLLKIGDFAFTSSNDEYRPVLILEKQPDMNCLVQGSNGVQFYIFENELLPTVVIEVALYKLQLKYREYQEFKNEQLEYN